MSDPHAIVFWNDILATEATATPSPWTMHKDSDGEFPCWRIMFDHGDGRRSLVATVDKEDDARLIVKLRNVAEPIARRMRAAS